MVSMSFGGVGSCPEYFSKLFESEAASGVVFMAAA